MARVQWCSDVKTRFFRTDGATYIIPERKPDDVTALEGLKLGICSGWIRLCVSYRQVDQSLAPSLCSPSVYTCYLVALPSFSILTGDC